MEGRSWAWAYTMDEIWNRVAIWAMRLWEAAGACSKAIRRLKCR